MMTAFVQCTSWRYLKLVTEPGGSAGVAGALAHAGDTRWAGKDIIAIALAAMLMMAFVLAIEGAI